MKISRGILMLGWVENIAPTFDEEMLIRANATTLLQVFCKIILNYKVIVKRSLDPDETFWRKSLSMDGLRIAIWGSFWSSQIDGSFPTRLGWRGIHLRCPTLGKEQMRSPECPPGTVPHCLSDKPLCCCWIIWQIQNDAKKLKNDRNHGKWVLIWESSARAI